MSKNKKIFYLITTILITMNPKIVTAKTLEKIEIDQNTVVGIIFFIILAILILIFISKILTSKKELNDSIMDYSNGLTDEELKKIDKNLNIELLKEQTFNLYKQLETAKTKQNLKNLKEIITDELCQEQENKINYLKEQKQKNVATNIKLEDFKILSIQKNDEVTNVLTYLHVSQYDYVINKKKEIIRGTNESEYQIEYKITIEQDSDNKFKIKQKECIGKWIKN